MKVICEFLFLAIFFAVFKVYGIYPAIASAIALYGGQLVFLYVKNKSLEKLQIFTFASVLILGGASLLFQNELFFKWKPTVIYWVIAAAILIAQRIRKRPSLQALLGQNLLLPQSIWLKLDCAWASFFGLLGLVNILVAYQFTTQVWVYFKLFGTLGTFLVFILIQMLWLSRYAKTQ